MVSVRILLVKDDSTEARDIKTTLESFGYSVHYLGRGEDVVEKASELRPDLILLDVVFKGDSTAFDALLEIFKLDFPVLLLVGDLTEENIKKIESLAQDAYLLKPYRDRELKYAIELAITREELKKSEKRNLNHLKTQDPGVAHPSGGNEKYQNALDNMMEGCQIISPDWRYIYVNDTALHHAQLEREALIGHTMMEVYPGIDETEMFWMLEKTMEEGESNHMENYFIYPDGTGRWFDLRVFPVPEGIFILSIDITDRKQVEEELIESKEFNENIIKAMGDGFSILDKNGVHLDVNPALCQMTGFSREELIGTGLPHPYWPEEKAHDIQATLEEVLKGNLKEVELTFKRKNGEEFPVILSPSIITDDEGKVIAVFGTFKDITQWKKLEMELKESEQKFRGLVENAADALFVHDMKGNIRDVNQQSVESLGYSREELLRMNVMEIEQDFELESARKEWMEIKPGEPFNLYGHQKRKDGTVFPVEIHFAAVEINQEKLVMGLVRDITAIKKAEEDLKAINRALMKRDEEFRHFIDSAPVAIAMFDPKMQYIAASQRWIEDFNLGDGEIHGRSHYDIFPEITEHWKKIHQRVLAGSVERADEDAFVRADGSVQYLRWEVHPWYSFPGEIGGIIIFSEDISERKRAEEELKAVNRVLKKRDEEFRHFIDSAPVAIAMFDPKMQYIAASQRWIEDFNLGDGEIHGRSHYDIFPEITEHWKKIHQRVLAGSVERADEDAFVRADGSVQYLRWEIHPWYSSPDVIGGIIIFSEDVTERKKAEKELRESEQKYRYVIETAAEGITLFDKKGTVIEINPKALELTGFKEDIIGKNLVQIVPSLKISLNEALVAFKNILTGKPIPSEWKYVNKRGERKFVKANYSLMRTDGKIDGIALVLEDITDLKLREMALRENEQFLENIIENIPDMIFVKSADELKFERVNRAVEFIWGYERDELIGKTDYDFFTREEADFYTQNDRKVLHKKELHDIIEETIHTRYQGERILHTKKIPLLDENGHPNYLLGISEDVTERKMAEMKLKKSLEEKEDLLREIHHRVKNNMQIISSLLNLQSAHVQEEESKEILKDSQSRVKSMAMIHEKLYTSHDLSHINFKQYTEKLVSDIFYTYKVQIGTIEPVLKVADIEFNMETAIPLGLIINELVTNSLKFAFPDTDKGSITVALETDGEEHNLIVEDDGIGLPEGFEFDKTDSLGLQLVNNLVAQIDGNITIDKSQGTKYSINFKELGYTERF